MNSTKYRKIETGENYFDPYIEEYVDVSLPLENFKELKNNEVIRSEKGNAYRIGKKIGEGNYGLVYQARKNENHFTALKLTKYDKNTENEIENLIRLSQYPDCNQYIVCYYESFKYKDQFFIVTEYLDGSSFEDFVYWYRKSFTYVIIWKIIQQLIMGIRFIHSKNMAHRDITKNNIVIDSEYQLKYIDFGLSCYDKECNKMSAYQKYYLPPDFYVKNRTIDLKFYQSYDMWCLGILLYEMIEKVNNPIMYDIPNEYQSNLSIEDNFLKKFAIKIEEPIIKFFLEKLLEIDPKKRFTAEQAYQYIMMYDKNFL